MKFNSSRKLNPTFVISPDSTSKLFAADGSENASVSNTDVYPNYITPWGGEFYVMNYGSGDIAENANGDHPEDWTIGARNLQQVGEIVNAFPRQMLKNLILVPGKDGTPIPVAGAYFTKMLDHEPGSIEPFSCLITNADGEINELTIVGNFSLSGGDDADTALNTFGKNNEIDCGYFP